jgi:hypothetical protein
MGHVPLHVGCVSPHAALGETHRQLPPSAVQTPSPSQWPPHIGAVATSQFGTPRLASLQSAMAGAGAFFARKRPLPSRLIVPGPKIAQFRAEPIVMRTATACRTTGARPCRANTLMYLPCFKAAVFTTEMPLGASVLANL